jgi:hypothetical protein
VVDFARISVIVAGAIGQHLVTVMPKNFAVVAAALDERRHH